MRYPLISSFRGTLMGAWIGEILAHKKVKNCQKSYSFTKIVTLSAESLITLARLDLADWQRRKQEYFTGDATVDISSQAIIATLPVVLFFHEHKIKLRQNLLDITQTYQSKPIIRDGTLAVGYAIAQSLTEQLHPHTLIPEIIYFIGETTSCLPQNLSKVNDLWEQKAGLERLESELSRETVESKTIATAFYCFLSTLEDYRLSVLRAVEIGNGLEATAAITGSLSGAYNSMVGIPMKLQQRLWQTNVSEWQLSNPWQMLKLTDALFSTWSGAYETTTNSNHLRENGFANGSNSYWQQAIAAPGVIRPILP